jgi:putative phosphoesterase
MIALISDIHGNYAALLAVLDRIDTMSVEHVICLGDVAGYYPQVNACVEELRARDIPCLLGNHDWYLAFDEPCPRSNSANRCIEHQRSVITEECMAWLRSLRPTANWQGIRLAHGGWKDPLDEYLRPSQEYFDALPGSVFASGHSHVAQVWKGVGKQHCNPGSVGQPRDGDPRASFAIWTGSAFSLHRVEYDIGQTEAAMAEAGFDAHFYENLRIGSRIGGQIDRPK